MFQTRKGKKLPGVNLPRPEFRNPPPSYRACILAYTLSFRSWIYTEAAITSGGRNHPPPLRVGGIMIPGARLATYFIANFSFHGWMKWPSGSRKAAVEGKRGRDKLNERAEGEDGPPLQGRDLWIKELQGWKEKKKKKKGRGEEKRGRKRRSVEKEGRRGWKE